MSPATEPGDGQRSFLVANEFARVKVRRDTSANGVRLHIQSLRNGQEIFLDSLQLESLTWMDDADFRTLLAEPFGPSSG